MTNIATAITTKYLDSEGLREVFKIISKYFRTKNETELRAGLALYEVVDDVFGDNGFLNQGKYYYKTTGVSSIKTYNYNPVDKDVMGEVVLEFTPSEDIAVISAFEFGDNMNVVWKNTDSLPTDLVSNKTYQLRMTTSNIMANDKYLMFAELTNFQEIAPPSESYIRIVYNGESNKFIPILNKSWLNDVYSNYNNSIGGIYFLPDTSKDSQQKWVKLNIYDLKTDNEVKFAGNTAEVRIQFNPGNKLTFKSILEGIEFESFESTDIKNEHIVDISRMFAGSNKNKISVDLSGFVGDRPGYNSCAGMFANRLFKLDGLTLINGSNGIQFNNIKNVSSMFVNSLKSADPEEAIKYSNMIDSLFILEESCRLSSCNNFSSMFEGCNVLGLDFSLWKGYGNSMDFSSMFKNANLTNSQLPGITEMIQNSVQDNGNEIQLNLSSMFAESNITDAGTIIINTIDDNGILSNINKPVRLYMSHMFNKCKYLVQAPILKIDNYIHIDCTNMFAEACTESATTELLSNVKNWIISPYNNKKNSLMIFNNMFIGCPLYKAKSFVFGENVDANNCQLQLHEMFNYTCRPINQQKKLGDYALWLNIHTSKYQSTIDNTMISDAETMLDKLNESITYVPGPKQGDVSDSQLRMLLEQGIRNDQDNGIINNNSIVAI